MTDLLPCPFCGSGWLYETRIDGYSNETPTMFCNSCKAIVTWEQVEEEGVNDETRTFVREHWNTRAEMSYKDALILLDELGISERTCHIEYPYYGDAPVINGQPRCSECKTEFAVGTFPNYCPNCGAKVVGE